MPRTLSPDPCNLKPRLAWYHNSALSIWLSVDPMSNKYPSTSPYTYCGNNPVKLVDPNGREIGHVDEAVQKKINALTNKNSADYSRAYTRQYHRLEKSKTVYNFYEATDDNITTKNTGKVIRGIDNSINIITSSIETERTSYFGGFSKEYATLFEETYHAADYDRGRLDLDNPTCMDEARAWKFATKAPGTKLGYVGINPLTASFAQTVSEWSCEQLADFFHNGGDAYTDTDDNGQKVFHPVLTKGDKNKTGLYSHFPLNKKNKGK